MTSIHPYFTALMALQETAIISSTAKKQAQVAHYLAKEPFFRGLCEAAYHPFMRFNMTIDISKIDINNGAGELPREEKFWDTLNFLRKREITAARAREIIQPWHPIVQWLFAGVVNKDLRAGFTDTILNKIEKNFVPSFDCMLAHKYEPKRIKSWPVATQPKLDGVRCLVRIEGSDIRFMSRTGKEEFASFPLIEQDLLASGLVGVAWIDGELTSGNFNKTVGDVRRKSAVIEDVILTTFECLTDAEFSAGVSDYDHDTRRDNLVGTIKPDFDFVKVIDETLCYSHEEVLAEYQRIRDLGGEGIIVKPPNGLYEAKRSYNWLKIKDQQSLDLECVGTFEGEGKYLGQLGGIIVDHKGVQVRVGSGFSDAQRKLAPDDFVTMIVEVEFHEITPDGSLRHPRFKGVRFDKTQPDA
jgi:DNA ligase-1